MSYSITQESEGPRMTAAVQALIAINVAIFFLQLTVVSDVDVWRALGFQLRDLTVQPWTIVTYMFVHAGLLHLAFNMYTLWLFGPRIEREWSPGSFARFYVWCGLGGWLFHMMLTRDGYLLGASAAVYGVMLAYAMRWPDDEVLLFFFIPMKVKWLVVLLAAVNLLSGLASGSGGGVAYFAHLGGFAFGWIYLRWSALGMGSIERLRQRMSQIPDIPDDETPRAIPRSQRRPRERDRGVGGVGGDDEIDDIVAKSNAVVSKGRVTMLPGTKRAERQKSEALNDVLDKISEHGIDSLTRDERRLLEEMSRRLRSD
ncbi:MAG: rhomboid family intramembrane serine protease [Gemmatimonadaceae bacterium]